MTDTLPPPPSVDLFEDLRGTLWALMVHAQTAQDYVDLRDLEGLRYALKSCDACILRTVPLFNEALKLEAADGR